MSTVICLVMIVLWVFVNVRYGEPVRYNSDLSAQWQLIKLWEANSH